MTSISNGRSVRIFSLICICILFQQALLAQRVKKSTTYWWVQGVWVNKYMTRYTYNNQGNRDSTCFYEWLSSSWSMNSVQTDTYSNGATVASDMKTWLGANTWSPQAQTLNTYTTGNKHVQTLHTNWDGSQYVNSYRLQYTYDQNVFATSYNFDTWQNNAWVGQFLYTYTNDAVGNPTLTIMQTYNSPSWQNSNRWQSTYTGTNVTVQNQDVWNGTWTPSRKVSYTYNSGGKLLTGLVQIYVSGNLENQSSQILTYAASGSTNVVRNWDQNTSSWVNSNMVIEEWDESIGLLETPKTTLGIYPSPTNRMITLTSTEGLRYLLIYDMKGTLMGRHESSSSVTTLDVSDLPPGVYLLRSDKGETARFLKE